MAKAVVKNSHVNQFVMGKLGEGVENIGSLAVNVLSSYCFPNVDEEPQKPKTESIKSSKCGSVNGGSCYKKMSTTKLSGHHRKFLGNCATSSNFMAPRNRYAPFQTRRFNSSAHSSTTSITRPQMPHFRPSRAQPVDWRLDSISRSSKLNPVSTMNAMTTVRNQLMRDTSDNEKQARDISNIISRDLMPFTQTIKEMIKAAPKKNPTARANNTSADFDDDQGRTYAFDGWNRPQREKLMSLERKETLYGTEDRFERNRLMRMAGGRSKNTNKTPRPSTSSAISSAVNNSSKDNSNVGQAQPVVQQRPIRTCIPGCEVDPPKKKPKTDPRKETDADGPDVNSDPVKNMRSLGQTMTARAFAPLQAIERTRPVKVKVSKMKIHNKSIATPYGTKKHYSGAGEPKPVQMTPPEPKYANWRCASNTSLENRKAASRDENANLKASMTVLVASTLPKPVQMYNTKHYTARRY